MKKLIALLSVSILLTACQTTNPRFDYINTNITSVNNYISVNKEEMSVLRNKIMNKCMWEPLERIKRSTTINDIFKYTLNGIIVFQLDETGKIIATFYESKERNPTASKCISSTAVGHKLPQPEGIEYIYAKYERKVE